MWFYNERESNKIIDSAILSNESDECNPKVKYSKHQRIIDFYRNIVTHPYIISAVKSSLARILQDYSFLSTRINATVGNLPDALSKTRNKLISLKDQLDNQRLTNGMTYKQVSEIVHNKGEYNIVRELTPKEQAMWVRYDLDMRGLKAFVSEILHGYDFEKNEVEKSNKQSTQYNAWKNYNPEQGKTEYLRWVLSATPYFSYHINVREAYERRSTKAKKTVDVRELDFALKEIGQQTLLLLAANPEMDIMGAFIVEAKKYAKDVGIETIKSNTVLSFIERFFMSSKDKNISFPSEDS